MRALIGDARNAVIGVGMMLAFREGWRSRFTVTPASVARSFGAAVLALPAYALFLLAGRYLVASQQGVAAEAGLDLFDAVIAYARIWLVFPVVAALVTLVLGLRARFAAWLVVHNWTVFVLLHVNAAMYLLYAAGIANLDMLSVMVQAYMLVRIFIHWRVAQGALGVTPVAAAGAALIPVIIDQLLIYLTLS